MGTGPGVGTGCGVAGGCGVPGGAGTLDIADVVGIRANAVNVRLRRLQLRLREAREPVSDHTATEGSRPDAGSGVG